MGRFKTTSVVGLTAIAFIIVAIVLSQIIAGIDSPGKYAAASMEKALNTRQDYIELPNGVYIGEVAEGLMNGKGFITFDTGDSINGEFKEGELSGIGTMVLPGYGKYVGDFKDNKRDGNGTFYFENGIELDCNWKDDKAYAPFKETFTDGSYFECEIYNNSGFEGKYVKEVEGIVFEYTVEESNVVSVSFETKEGAIVSGEFSGGKLNGECTIEFKNGDKYIGNIKNNKRDGQGKYTWSDGSCYDGEWKNDKMNGNGTYSWGTDYYLQGKWKDNSPDGTMKLYYDSDTFNASFKDGKCTKITYGG